MWKQAGRISLWRYTANERNFSGWHLNADSAGCASLLALLDELAERPGMPRTVRICAPEPAQLSVPNNQGGKAPWLAPQRLRLSCSDEASVWQFPSDLDPASLNFGAAWLSQLREGVKGIQAGRGDYCIGSDNDRSFNLWFWW